jgi:hypothetical protein
VKTRAAEKEIEAGHRRWRLYEALAELVDEHGVGDVAFVYSVLLDDLAEAARERSERLLSELRSQVMTRRDSNS